MIRLVATGLVFALIWSPLGAGAESGQLAEELADESAQLSSTWSATLIGQYRNDPTPENSNRVGGWFDQYEFVPNKSSSFPFCQFEVVVNHRGARIATSKTTMSLECCCNLAALRHGSKKICISNRVGYSRMF